MPISPEKKRLYPPNWKELRARVQERAGDKCETCGVANHAIGWRTPNGAFHDHADENVEGAMPEYALEADFDLIQIVCTAAHRFEGDEDTQDISRLVFECQRCHNRRDAPMRQRHAAETRNRKKFAGQPALFAAGAAQ